MTFNLIFVIIILERPAQLVFQNRSLKKKKIEIKLKSILLYLIIPTPDTEENGVNMKLISAVVGRKSGIWNPEREKLNSLLTTAKPRKSYEIKFEEISDRPELNVAKALNGILYSMKKKNTITAYSIHKSDNAFQIAVA